MESASSDASPETEVRRIVDAISAAVRARDVEAALAHYSPDTLLFDVIDPLSYKGIDALRQRLKQWLSSFSGPLEFHTHELRITAGQNVAFAHSLNQAVGELNNGGRLDMYWRATLCLARHEGRWLITHGHSSVPFNMETGQASSDLKP